MERVLITGAGGFLGSHLIAGSPLRSDLYGLTRSSTVNLEKDQWFRGSLTDRDHLLQTLDRINPQVVIHTAALSGEAACRDDVEEARKINVWSCGVLAEWCRANTSYMIFTSTDLVFDGRHAPYAESDMTGSEMIYGQLKAEAEALLFQYPGTMVVRLPLLYGIGLGDRKGLLHQFIQQALEGKEQGFFTDEFRTPACVTDVVEFIWKLVERRETGILHLGGRERVSRFELAGKFARHFDLPAHGLKPISRSDIHMGYRPEDTSLDSGKAYSLGFEPKTVDESLLAIKSRMPG